MTLSSNSSLQCLRPAELQTPVAFCLFNRPAETARVFAAIREARPAKLILVADGPRDHHPQDRAKVAAARAAVAQVDWDCEVIREYSERNLGTGRRVASGLDRVFSLVEEAIILEDDCLPDASFFRFCTELLDRYRSDPRVMMVSGTNNLVKWKEREQDYHFSQYGSIWGWATWRRAWQHYEFSLPSLDDNSVRTRVAASLKDEEQFERLTQGCDQARSGQLDTWDYQWDWTRLAQGGVAAVSAVNLITNIGFSAAATHTVHYNLLTAGMTRFAAPSVLRPNPNVAADSEYDRQWFLRMDSRPEFHSIINQGLALLEQGRHIHALIFFQETAKIRPELAELHYYASLALARLGRHPQALESLERFRRLCPEHEGGRLLFAELSAAAEQARRSS